jgi:hypothetical protein
MEYYTTRFKESMHCGVRAKESRFALDDEGYIKLMKRFNDLEQEAQLQAIRNKSLSKKIVARSRGTIA